MKKQGLMAVDVFEHLHAINLPIKYDTVLAWVNGGRNPAKKLNVVKRFDGDLAELIGLVLGDGTWRRKVKRGSYFAGRILYASKDIELATRAGKLMAFVLGREEPYRPYWSATNRVFVVECEASISQRYCPQR